MAKVNRLIEYPNKFNSTITTDQSALKRFITNFTTMMSDAGLVRSTDTGQLDVTNIPDLTLPYGVGNSTYMVHNPLIYIVDLNNNIPLYIKFQFGYVRSLSTNTNTANCFELISNVTIGTSTDGKGNLSNYLNGISLIGTSMPLYSDTAYNDNYYKEQYSNVEKNSYINYNRNTGILNIEILPNFLQYNTIFTASYGFSTGIKGTFLRLVISSTSDGFTVITQGLWSGNTSGLSYIKPLIGYLYNSSQYIDSSQNCFGTFKQITSTYKNGNIVTTPLLYLKSDQSTVDVNTKLLFGNANIIGNISGLNYNVSISDTEKHSYRTWSSGDTNIGFDQTQFGSCLLVLDD